MLHSHIHYTVEEYSVTCTQTLYWYAVGLYCLPSLTQHSIVSSRCLLSLVIYFVLIDNPYAYYLYCQMHANTCKLHILYIFDKQAVS